MNLSSVDNSIVQSVVDEFGIVENNIVECLSPQQLQTWVAYAVLGRSEQWIIENIFNSNKNVSVRMVNVILETAMLRILAKLLEDVDLGEYFTDNPTVKQRAEEMFRDISSEVAKRRKKG